MMNTEFEAKFLDITKESIRAKLKEVGATCEHPERDLKRILFGRNENPGMTVDYIRVRDEGGVIRLSAKVHAKPGGEMSDQKEAEVVVEDFDATVKILEEAGLKPTNDQHTKRETWRLDGAYIEIDTWPGLDPYIEIEAKSEAEVKRVADLLGVSWENKRVTAVTYIYMDKYKLSFDEAEHKIKHLRFEDYES